MAALAKAIPRARTSVLVSTRHQELQRQFCDILAEAGYACTAGDGTAEALHAPDVDLIIAEVQVEHTPVLAVRALAARPDLKLLFICSEPAYIGRALVPDRRVAFIEKPFAWDDLRRTILDLLTTRGARRLTLPFAAVA